MKGGTARVPQGITAGGQFTQAVRRESATVLVTSARPPLDSFSALDRRLLHNALLAQVDDNHAGGVMGWDTKEHDRAAALFDELEHGEHLADDSEIQRRVLLLSLLYPVHDLDHPPLTASEAESAEQMLDHLSAEFGR